jgi:tripeptide aminopeptidase
VTLRNGELSLFLELAALPSPPGEERAVADAVLRYLRDLGLSPDEDDAGPKIGSSIGNIYARLEPTAPGTPLFFCAHLDTVPPAGPLEPVVEDGVVRNAGGTILGADNKAAVVAMLEGVRRVLAENRPHAGIELLFTPKEELGLIGAYAFDDSRLQAQLGYVYDQAAPIGEIILGAPWAESMEVRYHGRASHSGMFPDEGRSAIQAAAKAIADLRLGRIDDETTANVGVISGGTGGNIVPEWCTFLAEARSRDERKLRELVQEMLDAFAFAAAATDCEVEVKAGKSYSGYVFKQDADVVQLAAEALRRAGYQPTYNYSGGAADANVFNEHGRRCVNLANGMTDIHTPDECITVEDLEGMTEVTLALVDVALAG